jgi:hypothetical protein
LVPAKPNNLKLARVIMPLLSFLVSFLLKAPFRRAALSASTNRRPVLSWPLLKILMGPVLAAALLTPLEAKAACDCGTISSIVQSAAEKIVSGVVRPLEAAVRQAASYETQNLHRDLVALREASILGQESIAAAIRAADRSAAERELERTFDTPSRPSTGCGDDRMGAVLLGGQQALAATGEALMDKLSERRGRFGRPVDYLRETESFPEPRKAAKSLGALSSGRTFTLEELKEAERALESLSDPYPPAKLPAQAAKAPAGKIYEAQKRDFERRQGLYQSVLAKRLAERAPTLEGLSDWAGSKWSEMGGEGPPPGLESGAMSKEALIWLLANVRLSSSNWHERLLPSLTEAGLLREMASMMATGLELQRSQAEHLGDIAMMMALEGLRSLEAGAGELLRLQYRRAMGSEANQ